MGESEGARSLLEGLDIGANTFFEISNMGAKTCRWKSGGKTLFDLLDKGVSTFFQPSYFPKPGLGTDKFWTVPNLKKK